LQVAELVTTAIGEKTSPKRATAYLRTLNIPELKKSDWKGQRGWAWRGPESSADQTLSDL
jgi:hypothetical protein